MKHTGNKRLIIIEAIMSPSTPSAKSMCGALPHLLAAGWDIEIWSSEMTLDDPRIRWRKVPRLTRIGHVHFWMFSAYVTLRYFRDRARGYITDTTLVNSVGPYMLWANVAYIHFVSVEYLKQIKVFREYLRPPLHQLLAHRAVSVLERIWWSIGSKKRAWLVVSERLGLDLEQSVKTDDLFVVLPNSYNGTRFNPNVRQQSKAAARAELGIPEGIAVFAFVCLGSFERKGFPLALEACHILHSRGVPCRLLVIGGHNNEPPDLTRFFEAAGITDHSFVVTHGRDPRIEFLLSAADALLFPSYSEAFSLVEIESAALGLRLYLTPHYGSEMILVDGVNGRLLPWKAAEIAPILEEDIRSGALSAGCGNAYQAVPDSEFGPLMELTLMRCLEWISGSPAPSPVKGTTSLSINS